MGQGFTAAESQAIREGFARLSADLPAATALFYRHLFRIDPGTRALFVADLGRQGAKLAHTLEVVVDGLDRWGALQEEVVALAFRHLAYGVRPEHYRSVEEALVLMLRDRLGAALSPEGERAWRRLLGALGATMTAAAYPAPDAGDAA